MEKTKLNTQETDSSADALGRALVSSPSVNLKDPPSFFQTIDEPAFGAILNAIQGYSNEKQISEIEAAREILRVFRKIDALWNQHLIQSSIQKH